MFFPSSAREREREREREILPMDRLTTSLLLVVEPLLHCTLSTVLSVQLAMASTAFASLTASACPLLVLFLLQTNAQAATDPF